MGKLLFQPGILEALSGAVAARLAVAGSETATDIANFKFSDVKTHTQGHPRKSEKKYSKKGGRKRSENARTQVLGKKGAFS